MNRFNAKQGHGYAAEQGNNLYDTILGRDAKILGDDNAKNGADRIVDGKLIQTKYCQTARASIDSGFKNGKYRYVDGNGNPMQLEVPSDQYEEAVKFMAKKIESGQVPKCNDPNKASELVRRGNLTLEQAVNVAKAGTIESITFDSIHGAVIGTSAAGISASIIFARALWNGQSINEALDTAVSTGLHAGGIAFLTSVISAQITKTSLNNLLLGPSNEVTKLLPTSVRRNMSEIIGNTAPIYGASSSNNLAKLLRTNFIVQAVSILVLSSTDIFNYARGKISGKQLFKEVATISGGIVGTASAGSLSGSLALSASLGPIGIGVATIIGSIIGGGISTSLTRKLLDSFIEDDAVKLIKIINSRLSILAQDYLLSQEELELVVDILRECLVKSKLLEMFASQNYVQFADDLLIKCIESIIKWRTRIIIPNYCQFLESANRVIDGLEKNTFKLSMISKINAKDIANTLLERDISEETAKKAWYVTKQFNLIGMQSELILDNIKVNENNYHKSMQYTKKQLEASKNEFTSNLNELEITKI